MPSFFKAKSDDEGKEKDLPTSLPVIHEEDEKEMSSEASASSDTLDAGKIEEGASPSGDVFEKQVDLHPFGMEIQESEDTMIETESDSPGSLELMDQGLLLEKIASIGTKTQEILAGIHDLRGLVDVAAVRQDAADQMALTGEFMKKAPLEIREMRRLLQNELSSQIRKMQDDLERYREIEKGWIFDDLLRSIAQIYIDYSPAMLQDKTNELSLTAEYLFDDILQLLEAYGVTMLKSKPGEPRDKRHCQVRKRIPTEEQHCHDKVVSSLSPGFFIENRTLIRELIELNVYEAQDSTAGDEKEDLS